MPRDRRATYVVTSYRLDDTVLKNSTVVYRKVLSYRAKWQSIKWRPRYLDLYRIAKYSSRMQPIPLASHPRSSAFRFAFIPFAYNATDALARVIPARRDVPLPAAACKIGVSWERGFDPRRVLYPMVRGYGRGRKVDGLTERARPLLWHIKASLYTAWQKEWK